MVKVENTIDALFAKMNNIVNRYVKCYKQDFEKDKKNLKEIANGEIKEYKRLVWIVRECGTNLCYRHDVPNNGTYLYYLDIDNTGNRYYEVDLNKYTCKYIRDPKQYYLRCEYEERMYGTCA